MQTFRVFLAHLSRLQKSGSPIWSDKVTTTGVTIPIMVTQAKFVAIASVAAVFDGKQELRYFVRVAGYPN